MSRWQWREGNRVRLLENGEQFFPRVFECIAAAREEVIIETFILFEDAVGRELQGLITAAARRGVRVELTVDGYGSESLSQDFIRDLQAAGVELHMFEPARRLFGSRVNILRRLHRKIVVIDRRLAFVGGINYSVDHLLDQGQKSKQDYAVEVEGPVVADIHLLAGSLPRSGRPPPRHGWWRHWRRSGAAPALPAAAGEARVLLASRDNQLHRDDIERLYRIALRSARQRVVIANAYFFPGYRLIRELRKAARRGVQVQLILQGNPDMPWVSLLTRALYRHLARAGVEIHEYCARPIHAKVAVIDAEWATVGSSNLDPLSLALNLEANLFIHDREFTAGLHSNLQELIQKHCRRVNPEQLRHPPLGALLLSYLAYHCTRYFPALIRSLPSMAPVREALTRPQAALADSEKALPQEER
ncbi:MAG: cardiolipin synthase ClsB [Stagnimonas sp.]|nr:cardiolipin synthase ClsB [Stagnimonas sp.]